MENLILITFAGMVVISIIIGFIIMLTNEENNAKF